MTKEAFLINVGKNIRRIRIEAGLSQVDLATRTGKDKQSINRLEKGGHNISVYILYEIAEVLKVDIRDLLDFE